jgi:predicted ATPase/class 3 adenylate cyclase/DNA-binding CsgD family transcriptional regulator
MPDLPTGTITFLFTDIEGSTRLLQQLGERYTSILTEYRQLLRAACVQYNGHEVDTQGDAFFVAFARAIDALWAAVAIQRALASHPWPQDVMVRARLGLHTGEPLLGSEGYVGLDVHHAIHITSAGHGGQILVSQTTRELVAHNLPEDMHLRDLGEHRLKDLQHPSRLFQLLCPDLSTDFPPLKTLDAHPNNLPVQPTHFIGREREVAGVGELLCRPGVRLLTLTGPAGVGKTRLGLQVAAELSDDCSDGVFFVALAPLSDAKLVAPTIVQALDISETGNQPPLARLAAALKEKHLLLLLDNFEQVVAAASQIAELLTACPKLKMLVTSRVGLHVRAEHEFAVPPLTLPNLKLRLPDPVALSQYEAVALFIERAQAVKPDFQVTNANAPAVAEICTRLDGLPLAIELAAARSKAFPPQTLLARLKQGLAVLTTQVRDLPVRQQTLRGAIAWSYDLLTLEEQRLFRRLAVFVDGCTFQAAEQVCTAAGGLEGDILELLASLVDKSLLQQVEQVDGEARFWMLQTLREYGLECLASEGETETTRRAHASYYLALAEEAEAALRGPQQVRWLVQLEQEHENLRAALQWLLEQAEGAHARGDKAEMALQLAGALWRFWSVRGHLSEGRHWLERVLTGETLQAGRLAGTQVAASLRAKALTGAGSLALSQDDCDQAEAPCRESLELYRKLGEKAGMAFSLQQLADIAYRRSNYAQARSLLEEALLLFKEVKDEEGMASVLDDLAYGATDQGEYTRARELAEQALAILREVNDKRSITYALLRLGRVLYFSRVDLTRSRRLAEEALTISKEVGYKWGRASSLGLLGQLALLEGEDTMARTMLEEALAIRMELGDRWGIAWGLYSLGSVHTFQGDYTMARRLYEESLAIARKLEDKEFTATCLEELGEVVAAQGEPACAAQLWGEAESLRQTIGAPLAPVNRATYERAVAAVRSDLGEQAFATAWAEGRTMTAGQALPAQEAVPMSPSMEARQPSIPPTGPILLAGLTAREVEVLRLIAQGRTDAQIAEHLVISPRTVNHHTTSLYSKLGVSSRAAATRYALEHNLL